MFQPPVVGVVEDSEVDLLILRRTFRKADPNREIVAFPDPDAALCYLRLPSRKPFELLLVDINLPRMTGFQFVDTYAALHPDHRRDTRIVIMSHSVDPKDRERAEANPAVHAFFPKPVTADELRTMFSAVET